MSAPEWPWSRAMRPMLQAEAAKCGLACLAMVAAHHGHRVNIGGLRRQFPISLKGATLAQLIEIAARLELASRPLRLELDELGKLATLAILHWDLNHFVVLKRADARAITILDPAAGRRVIAFEKVSKHFTGVALELSPTADFKPIDTRVRLHLSDLSGAAGEFLQCVHPVDVTLAAVADDSADAALFHAPDD